MNYAENCLGPAPSQAFAAAAVTKIEEVLKAAACCAPPVCDPEMHLLPGRQLHDEEARKLQEQGLRLPRSPRSPRRPRRPRSLRRPRRPQEASGSHPQELCQDDLLAAVGDADAMIIRSDIVDQAAEVCLLVSEP